MTAPLSHIRVLDMSRILAGPWAAQTLADLGAEVIKIERPGTGDDTRTWGPPFIQDTEGNETQESAYFLSTNRGKKSVALDISKPEGQEVLRKLAAKSDILIENYKVGGLAGYGLGYEDLKKINPGLIYCSITGFGQTGPFSSRAGYDFLIQAMGGIMSVTGEADGKPGAGPQKIGIALTDVLTGLYTNIAALSALARREKTGEGCHIDMALLDVTTATMANQALNYLVTGNSPTRMGNAHPNIVPYEAFEASDMYLIVAVGNDGQFTRFVEAAGQPDLATDERFATNAARVENRDVLIPIIKDFMKQKTGQEWIDDLEKVGVPCGPLNNMEQVFAHPQVQARGMQMELDHPLAGTVPQVASPIKITGEEFEYQGAPPTLGQHSEHVLGEVLDMSEDEITALRDSGVLGK
ncbi:MAG: CoA transferase [Rhodospirillaceae bacterium]|nr:CoA transferase [Rhodospirillaceae bacterium]|tara:strand:+ start:21089 stop:22318 length:1230 start_codon:yes stop_codon:yes gene_type:complete